MKYLIFDAGPIISLTMNGMLGILEGLKKNFDGEFVLTSQVKKEVIDNPLKIKRFELEAIQVKNLLDNGTFKMANEIISPQKIEKETANIIKITSSFLRTTDTREKIKIFHDGEASCIAFSKLCNVENVIVTDERSVRWFSESPERLEELMERKLHTPLTQDESIPRNFKNLRYIRSSELLFIAYKKGLIPFKDKQTLDALLYSVKFKGTAITTQEIEEMKKLV